MCRPTSDCGEGGGACMRDFRRGFHGLRVDEWTLTMKVSAWIPLVITPLYYRGGGRRSYILRADIRHQRNAPPQGKCLSGGDYSFTGFSLIPWLTGYWAQACVSLRAVQSPKNPRLNVQAEGASAFQREKAGGTPLCTGTVTISAGVRKPRDQVQVLLRRPRSFRGPLLAPP